MLLLLMPPSISAQGVDIVIDGDMDDWLGVPNALNDSADDVPWINLVGVQIVNDSEYLYYRMLYSGRVEYDLLWANLTVRNMANDVFVVMAFVSVGFTQEDTWVFAGTDLDNPYNNNSIPEPIAYNQGWAKVDNETYTSIEFKITLASISSGNMSNVEKLDMVFWHYDTFSAGLGLLQDEGYDRAPDTGFFTYYPGEGISLTPVENQPINETTTNQVPLVLVPSAIILLIMRRRSSQ